MVDIINEYAYLVSIPLFIILIVLELFIGWKTKQQNYQTKDTLMNVSSGVIYFALSLAAKSMKLFLFFYVYDHFRLFTIDYFIWWTWVVLFFLDDLTFYWGHRIGHTVSFYWASHVVHHSSKYFNFSTALRKTWTYDLTGHFIFWIWLAILGFHPLQIFAIKTLNFIYQYWIHTEKIGKLPKPIEFIFNTPSHHRVHHGSDLKYLDRNHAGVLIIWDRLFGTFQEEEELPNYGLTSNIKSNSLFEIEFHEWKSLFIRIKNSNNLITRIKYLLKPPGWSPDKSTLTTKELREKEISQRQH